MSPGPHAWAALAWSEASLGNIEAARKAMGTSWAIAPYNFELAVNRLEFVALMEEQIAFEAEFAEEGDEEVLPPLSTSELESAQRDITLLASRAYPLALEITESTDVLASMLSKIPAE